MAKLIFIAGMRGSGKSTTMRRYADRAFGIQSDVVQHDATRRAFPYVKKSHEYSWSAWPREIGTMHIRAVLRLSIESIATGIRDHRGHIIVEGAILANDWFRNPFRDVLTILGHEFDDSDVKLFHLKPPAQTVFEHIHGRANELDYRRKEIAIYPRVEDVEKDQAGYCRAFTTDIWEVITTNDALDSAIQAVL